MGRRYGQNVNGWLCDERPVESYLDLRILDDAILLGRLQQVLVDGRGHDGTIAFCQDMQILLGVSSEMDMQGWSCKYVELARLNTVDVYRQHLVEG